MMINGMFPGTLNPTKTVAGCIDIYGDVIDIAFELGIIKGSWNTLLVIRLTVGIKCENT
jgi:hypothetical protein